MRRAALLAVATLLVAAGPASATLVDDALAIAHRHYPAACSPVQVADPQTDPYPNGQWSDLHYDAAAYLGPNPPECKMWLDPSWTTWTWARLCDVVVHEVGHLSGLGHSDDPNDPMSPTEHPLPGICGSEAFVPGRPQMQPDVESQGWTEDKPRHHHRRHRK